MDQKSNYLTIEINMKVSMLDYRIVLGLKKTWIVAAIVGVIQLIAWTLQRTHQ